MTDEELEACAVCGAILDAEGNCDNPACETNADLDLDEDTEDGDEEAEELETDETDPWYVDPEDSKED